MPGYKQDLGNHRDHSRPASSDGSSCLFDHLLHLWSVQKLSATACQEIAKSAYLDGLRHPSISKLASLGAWGQQTSNISRDLKAFVCKESGEAYAAPVVARSILCRNPSTGKGEEADIYFFNAAAVVSSLHKSQAHFTAMMKPELAAEYWSNIKRDDPKLQVLLRESSITEQDLPNTLPLWVAGDGVEYVDGRSLTVWSFGSVLNVEPALQSSMMLFAVPKDCLLPESNEQLWAHIIPCFLNLQNGTFAAGFPIAGGFKFIIWNILGDQ